MYVYRLCLLHNVHYVICKCPYLLTIFILISPKLESLDLRFSNEDTTPTPTHDALPTPISLISLSLLPRPSSTTCLPSIHVRLPQVYLPPGSWQRTVEVVVGSYSVRFLV